MVTLVPMGYGVTDENGVAKLDHDMDGNTLTHSYTGVGAGRIDLLASIDDPDNVSYSGEGTLVSEIYGVLDCIKYDKGTSNVHNDIWDRTEIVRGDNYTTLQSTNGARTFNFMSLTDSSNLKIKFKLWNTDFSNIWFGWSFTSSSQQTNTISGFYGISASGLVDITITGNDVTVKLDNVTVKTFTFNKQLSEQYQIIQELLGFLFICSKKSDAIKKLVMILYAITCLIQMKMYLQKYRAWILKKLKK